MSTQKLQKIKNLIARILRALSLPFSSIIGRIRKRPENISGGPINPYVFAYQLVGKRTTRILPLFRDVDVNLQKAGLRISFKAYISWAILACLLVSIFTLIIVPLSLIFLAHLPLASSLLFGMGCAMFTGAFTIIGFYVYPIYRADCLKRDLEDALPFTTSYMAILAGAGVPTDRVFASLANARISSAVSTEARMVVRDVELFGYDILSAMENTSKRTPSEKFKETLEGLIGTVHSGGNLASYLANRSTQYMKLKRIALRKFSDTLSVLAEFYITLLVVGPLIFVVMLAVMGMLGGGGFGPMDPSLLLNLLAYIGIPVGSLMFLILLDMVSPRD